LSQQGYSAGWPDLACHSCLNNISGGVAACAILSILSVDKLS
jgi:hypothetical protein